MTTITLTDNGKLNLLKLLFNALRHNEDLLLHHFDSLKDIDKELKDKVLSKHLGNYYDTDEVIETTDKLDLYIILVNLLRLDKLIGNTTIVNCQIEIIRYELDLSDKHINALEKDISQL